MTQSTDSRPNAETSPVRRVAVVIVLLLLGLPVAAWLDLRQLSDRSLRAQAEELNAVIDGIRGYYGREVVGRLLAADPPAKVVHNFRDVPGAIPIPATLSIELGRVVGDFAGNVRYRFVSDLPFRGRRPHELDGFEELALRSLRAEPKQIIEEVTGSLFNRQIRLAAPVVLAQACVNCHNAHPDSPRRDWKVGDVRGIQEIIVHQPIAANILAFKWLLLYFACAATFGVGFVLMQRRQAAAMRGVNRDLEHANEFLAAVSMKIAKYLSPQIYRSIFSGQKDVALVTERKKLTIFFSDIKDFTATTERLQPEELTEILNDYLTEMSAIASRHGATVDKFMGDAILAFFGDPETRGVAEDANACLRMAIDMQRQVARLNAKWRQRGIEYPFRVRMGINTGFCNVGNFGSSDRMDYTIIGAEANVAARLQSIAEPGGIVLSYETYALVRDAVRARPLPPISMKGISRDVVPYAVEGFVGESGQRAAVISEHGPGVDVFLDVDVIEAGAAARARRALVDALAALDARAAAAAAPRADGQGFGPGLDAPPHPAGS